MHCLLSGSSPVCAQSGVVSPRPFFDRISTEQGLTSNAVTALYRDNRGFLWVGTINGLNQYDGTRVISYRHQSSRPATLPDNLVHSITGDDSGYLWVGTNGGLSRVNPFDHTVVNYQHNQHEPSSLNSNFNCRAYIDRHHTLWVGNELGLSRMDRPGRFQPVPILPDSLARPTLSAVGAFLEDTRGRFWIGTYSGLVCYDRGTHTHRLYPLPQTAGGRPHPVTSLLQDHAGRIWVGSWGAGLNLFDPDSGVFHSYKWNHFSPFTEAVNVVFSLAESRDREGRYVLWAGTSEGLLMIDTLPLSPAHISRLLPDPSYAHSLSGKEVSSLLTDAENVLWAGTENGLDAYLLKNQSFAHEFPVSGSVTRIWVDPSQTPRHYFVATWYGAGLTELDANFRKIHSWLRVPPGSRDKHNRQISDVLRTRDGTLWVATLGGLYHYDANRGRFLGFPATGDPAYRPATNRLTSLVEDQDGVLYIGTYGMGMDSYNPRTRRFTHYPYREGDSAGLPDRLVWSLYRDREDRIWVLTDAGLALLDKQKRSFRRFISHPGEPGSISGRTPSGMVEDIPGVYWIATDKGLNRLDLSTGLAELFDEESGLKDNDLLCLVRDDAGFLWMGTHGGLSRFDPRTRRFANYGALHGLPVSHSFRTLVSDGRGRLIVGTDGMCIAFSPGDFSRPARPPAVYLSDFTYAGHPLPVHGPLQHAGPVVVPYPASDFSVTYSAPEFFGGGALRYAYRLVGLDTQWVNAGTRNFVSYASLAPGDYRLQVRVAGADGVWSDRSLSLAIRVLPPFWKTWWFRTGSLGLVIVAVYALFVYRVRRIRREEALKTSQHKQIADMRLSALRARMNPHFMFNALNSIQQCIFSGDSPAAYKYLSRFSRLVRMTLDHTEHTLISLSGEIEMLTLYLQLESLRFQQSFHWEIAHEGIETDFLQLPPMLIQPFVENALWHGLAHKQGDKVLQIRFRADDRFVYVEIEDNGVGREAAGKRPRQHGPPHESVGIRIATEQLEAVSRLASLPSGMEVEDLHGPLDREGLPRAAGTRVTLTIPVMGG